MTIDEAKEVLKAVVFIIPQEYYSDKIDEALDMAIKALEEQKTGKWIGIEYEGYADGNPVYDVYECSSCGYVHNGESDTLSDYCPDCGAKMETGALDGKAIDFEKLEKECEA